MFFCQTHWIKEALGTRCGCQKPGTTGLMIAIDEQDHGLFKPILGHPLSEPLGRIKYGG